MLQLVLLLHMSLVWLTQIVKNNIQVVELHMRLTMNGILNDFLKKGHS